MNHKGSCIRYEKYIIETTHKKTCNNLWEKTQGDEIERMFPFNRSTLEDAIKLLSNYNASGVHIIV